MTVLNSTYTHNEKVTRQKIQNPPSAPSQIRELKKKRLAGLSHSHVKTSDTSTTEASSLDKETSKRPIPPTWVGVSAAVSHGQLHQAQARHHVFVIEPLGL